MFTKGLAIAFMGVLLIVTAMGQKCCAKDFAPVLKKIIINGKVFFEAGKTKNKTIEIDSRKVTKIQYLFKNTGTEATTVSGKIFVHFHYNTKILISCDFWPKTLTTKWKKDFVFAQTNKVNFQKAKGRTIIMMLGIYFPNAKGVRLKFKGVDSCKRFTVGKIVVK